MREITEEEIKRHIISESQRTVKNEAVFKDCFLINLSEYNGYYEE